MPLTLEDIKKKHDKNYLYPQTTREMAAEDTVFAWVDQWGDGGVEGAQLAYRGVFDLIRKTIRDILSSLSANPVQVDFKAVEEENTEVEEAMDGIYRAGNQENTSLEAKSNAAQEMVVCGFGAYEIYTEYESLSSEDNNNQVLRRRPLHEANNTVFFDANAKLLDKSDAMDCSILTGYTEEGYKDLAEELTGERPEDINPSSFGTPEDSLMFPWIESGSVDTIYVATFYKREIVKKKIITFRNPLGEETKLYESDLKDVMDDMIDEGWEILSEKEINRWQVTKYIVSGEEILNGEMGSDGERGGEVIAGENIPVIPLYGERAIIEGEEYWEGIVRLAKDPQRLRNFQLSYLADIASRSPRPKPIFFQEQISGFEEMYEESGADNNLPYYLQNRKAEGELLPLGPVTTMPDQPIPSALVASIQLSREAVLDVANPGPLQDMVDPDLSGKAALIINNKVDQQHAVYQNHTKHAERRDGEVSASMLAEIIDTPRTIDIILKDGTRKKIKMMEQVVDGETGETVTLNDINNVEFKVFSKIGPSYNSMKEQTLDRLEKMMQVTPPGTPEHKILMLESMKLTDGSDFDDFRNHANKELVTMGYKKPETDEEEQMLAEAQQNQQPSPEMVLAMAEDKTGTAAMMKERREDSKLQLEMQNMDTDNRIDAFKAKTDRMEAQIKALEAGAKIDNTNMDTFSKQLDNESKIKQLLQPVDMSDSELMAELTAA